MCGVEHTISLFFKDVSNIPVAKKIITDNKVIYNLFGYCIYHEPHSIFKQKLYEFHNKNIGLLGGNYTRMSGYFIGIHGYVRIRKELAYVITARLVVMVERQLN